MSPLAAPRFVIGCGYLGRRAAGLWTARGERVAALTRRNSDALRATGLEPVVGDVTEPSSLSALPPAETVLYAVGLDRAAGKPMRDVYVRGLENVLRALPRIGRFVYVSSTSVYGQTAGEWVNESAPTEPVEESGKIVLEAEQLLRATRPDAIILRFAGIYGPNRLLRKQPILKGEPLVGDAEKWLNLIHVADGATAVLAATERGAPGSTYNIADGGPVSRREFYSLLARVLNAPDAQFEQRAEPGAANRRIDASKARAELNWSPQFAHANTGLPAAVADSTN